PAFFVVCDSAPTCEVHCKKKCHGKWYWVPPEAGPAFQELVLKTTFMRGPETAPPGAYEVQIVKVGPPEENPKKGTVIANVFFDKEVPNVIATMVFKHEGRTVKIRVSNTPELNKDKKVPLDGDLVTSLQAQWNPKTQGVSPDDLRNKHVRIYSYL